MLRKSKIRKRENAKYIKGNKYRTIELDRKTRKKRDMRECPTWSTNARLA